MSGTAPAAAPRFLARAERFAVVGSTNDVVRGWLADGTPEVCVAIADEQTAGRGRDGRSWVAPPGSALLCSIGFRPTWLDPDRAWRLAAIVSLAMAEAGESVAGLLPGTVGLKWPNDLVVAGPLEVRKVAGVLGETDGLGTDDPRVVVGIGINADWTRADFPPDLAPSMTSLRVVAGGRPVDTEALAETFLGLLEPAVEDLRAGRFDAEGWAARQVTTGRGVDLVGPDGTVSTAEGRGVDPGTGALRVAGPDGAIRPILVGEVRHVRVAPQAPSSASQPAQPAGRV